jgi:hypothetical protein
MVTEQADQPSLLRYHPGWFNAVETLDIIPPNPSEQSLRASHPVTCMYTQMMGSITLFPAPAELTRSPTRLSQNGFYIARLSLITLNCNQ